MIYVIVVNSLLLIYLNLHSYSQMPPFQLHYWLQDSSTERDQFVDNGDLPTDYVGKS